MKIEIPGVNTYDIKHLLFDYNGTIASSGKPLDVISQLENLSHFYNVSILTGNTFGDVEDFLSCDNIELIITKTADDKLAYLESLQADSCIAIGNGSIDYKMLQAAAIGFAVIGDEGCSCKALQNADIIVTDIKDAITMINYPTKIIATLKE